MMRMELTQLRYFVAVAEELNFRRAAERCRVAQPALSRRIKRLEEELGVLLLRRTKREVELTEAGRAFLEAAREGIARIDAGARELRGMSDFRDSLVVGAVEYANFGFLPRVMKLFQERHPEARLVRRDLPPAEQVEALLRGELDVAFQGVVRRRKDLAYLPVAHADWRVALPAGHPAADREEVLAEEVAVEPLILFPRYANPGLYDWVLRRVREVAGAEPRVVQEPTQLHATLNLVAEGFGVFPTPFDLPEDAGTRVAVRKVSGFDIGVWVCAVSRRRDASLLVQDFLDTVRSDAERAAR